MRNYTTPETMLDWMNDHEKRLQWQVRRPMVHTASDLMGPGLGPQAVQLMDWSDDETIAFNGVYFSSPGALDSPDTGLWWMGESWCDPNGYGYQKVVNYRGGDPTIVKVRTFAPTAGTRLFSTWVDG